MMIITCRRRKAEGFFPFMSLGFCYLFLFWGVEGFFHKSLLSASSFTNNKPCFELHGYLSTVGGGGALLSPAYYYQKREGNENEKKIGFR